MRSKSSAAVFDSPAVPLVLELEDAAMQAGASLSVTVAPSGKLLVAPPAILTPERIEAIRKHRDALRVLVLICDEGVIARRAAFADGRRIDGRAADGDSGCSACGDMCGTVARCWRCQLAARLSAGSEITCDWTPAGYVAADQGGVSSW